MYEEEGRVDLILDFCTPKSGVNNTDGKETVMKMYRPVYIIDIVTNDSNESVDLKPLIYCLRQRLGLFLKLLGKLPGSPD